MEQTQNSTGTPPALAALGFLTGLFSLALTPPLGLLPAGTAVALLKVFDYGMMAGFFWGARYARIREKIELRVFLTGGGVFWLGMNLWDLVLWATGNFR